MSSRILSLFFIICLASCTTLDPYTGESKTSNVVKGAGVGAVVGAAIGAATAGKDKKKGAVQGAVAGGLIGGGVGYYMDQQELKLRKRLEGTGVSVTRNGDNIRLNMPGNVTFGVNSDSIRPDFINVLEGVTIILKEFDKTNVKIVGHTDSTGNANYNQQLSERRANSVKGFLASQGVSPGRLFSQGLGARSPIADNGSEGGRQQNRRVEIELIPLS